MGNPKAHSDLMLLLLRAQVPNAEVLTTNTDRDLALLAVKYDVELPMHLAHLPTLPPQRTESEAALLAEQLAQQSWDPMESEPLKDRPPRRVPTTLRSASKLSLTKELKRKSAKGSD